MAAQASDEWDDLLFGVRRSIRYHSRRRHFYESFHSWVSFLNVLMGSAAVIAIIGNHGPRVGAWLAAACAFFSGIDLIVGTLPRANEHRDLMRRFIDLEREINLTATRSPETLVRLTNSRLTIEADEPPVLPTLDLVCHNELMRSMGYRADDPAMVRIGFFRKLFANLI